MRLSRRSDSGIATLWGLAIIGILLLFAAVAAGVVSLIGARHQAETAADLAALAGAQTVAYGDGDPCQVASWVAVANRGRLTRCAVDGDSVEVRVEVESPRLLGQTWTLTGRARAGPADAAP
jgi:secretion/DNA translocation related TadE-like protein